jgi:acyl dehydratase
MPLSSEVVGRTGEPVVHEIDTRWTMAYAAALGHTEPIYTDTLARPDVLAHPLFPVCFEWPIFLSGRHLPSTKALTIEERLRGVHATHDLQLHRPLRAGMRVTTRATIVRVEARRPGAYQVVRLDSVADDGEPVCTTWYGTLMRGVAVAGGDRVHEGGEPPLEPATAAVPKLEVEIPIPAGLAHVYTECARIWNPIHTDAAVAARAGLPEIILHGTATLALAVSAIVRHALDGDPERVRRIAGRFAAMVPLPSTCTLRLLDAPGGAIRFDVLNGAGETALRDGLLEVHS